LNIADVDTSTFDLSAKNSNKKEEAALRSPQTILEEMKSLDEESAIILNSIFELL
jgi:type I restriction enzyme M protein